MIKKLFNKIFGVDKTVRVHVKNVKPGDWIEIEWDRINGGIGSLKCINNDPKTKTILLEVTWDNVEDESDKKQKLIVRYNDYKLKNFHLLNQFKIKIEDVDSNEIENLENMIQCALENEEYEKIEELKEKLNKLLKKQK
jgi:hypothetical protein